MTLRFDRKMRNFSLDVEVGFCYCYVKFLGRELESESGRTLGNVGRRDQRGRVRGMGGLIAPFTASLFISAGISAVVAIYIQRWRDTPGVQAFTLQMIFQAVWALGFALETIAVDLPTKSLFRKLAWIGILLVPAYWMEFVMRYTRTDQWLNRRVYLAAGSIIFLLLLAAFTNEWHYLFWSKTVLQPGVGTGVAYERGPFFWVAVGLAYAIVVSALVELVYASALSPKIYRRQAIVLVFAALFPLVTSTLFVLGVLKPNDWTPLAFALTGLVVSWAIFRYRLFNLVPVARGQLFDNLSDGLLVLDTQDRVVDANAALLRMVGWNRRVPAGEPVDLLLEQVPFLLSALRSAPSVQPHLVFEPDGTKVYTLEEAAIRHTGQVVNGRLFVIRDITDRQQIEERLKISEENLQKMFQANPFPLAIIGLDHSTIYECNQAFLDFFRRTKESVLGTPASSFFASPEIREHLLGRLALDKRLRSETIPLKRGENEIRTVMMNAEPFVYLGEPRLAVSFADITERLQLEQAEREQRLFAEALHETGELIHSTLDLDEVLDRILQTLSRVLKFDAANITMMDDQGTITVARTTGYDRMGWKSPFGNIWLSLNVAPNLRRMVENHKPEIRDDVTRDADWIKVTGMEWVRSHLAAPIITTQGVVGFINLDAARPAFFTQNDAERLMIFANQTGVAIDNARLYARIRKAAQEAEVIQQITQTAGSSLRTEEVFQKIFDLVNLLIPSDSASLILIDGEDLVIKAMRGFTERDSLLGLRWPIAGTLNERVRQAKEPLMVADVQAEYDGYRNPPHNQIRSVLMIPLIAGGNVVGFLSLDSWVLARFSEEDLRLAGLFSGAISAALENAQLFNQAQRRADELEILYQAGVAVTSGLDLDRVLVVLYEQCRRVMPSDSFYVALYNEESGLIDFPLFQDQGVFRQVAPLNIRERKGMAGNVIEERRTIYLPDTLHPDSPEKYTLIRYGGIPTRSYLGVPLFLRDKVIGVISMQSTQPNAYSDDQIHLLETISTQAAVAIENARLYRVAQFAATTDDLTQLLNRRELFRRAEQEFERANRYRHPLAMMMIDFDRFKVVNDTYGHMAGDQVLRTMARVVQENMRLVDVVGRYGGEEILVLMPETNAEQAIGAAERLRKQVEETVVVANGVEIQVTISVGITGLSTAEGQTLATMIGRADAALMKAKQSGRNRVCHH